MSKYFDKKGLEKYVLLLVGLEWLVLAALLPKGFLALTKKQTGP